MVRVKSGDKAKFKELVEEFQGTDMHRHQLDNFLSKAGPLKIPIAIEHVQESIAGGSTHMMVLTHFKESAKAIYEGLQDLKDVSVYHYDGDISASERNRITKEATNAGRAVIVSTMHAVKEGVDLTRFTDSIAAELYWQPATIIQLLGRYHRLSSRVAARFRFLVLAGSLDEIIAKVLRRRITDMGKVIEHGVSEEKFQDAFEGKKLTDTEVLAELKKAAGGRVEFDEYT
jgi:ERCC4-related helicase